MKRTPCPQHTQHEALHPAPDSLVAIAPADVRPGVAWSSRDNMGVITLAPVPPDADGNRDENYSCGVQPNLHLPVDVHSTGQSCWYKGDRIMRKQPLSYAVELVLEGRGELLYDRRRHELLPGDVFILHPGKRHQYRAVSGLWRKVYITFWPLDARTDALMHTLGLHEVPHLHLEPGVRAQCAELLERIFTCARGMEAGFRARTSLLTYELLVLLTSTLYDLSDVPRVHPCVAHAIEIMHRALHERITVDIVAREAGCSPTHLNRLFKQYLGMKAHEWMECYRLHNAAALLRKSSKRLHLIAEEVGYSDPYYFSTAFKRVSGLSPSEYRRKAQHDRMPGGGGDEPPGPPPAPRPRRRR